MTDDTRDAIADLVLLGVAAGAVYLVARHPPLRRVAWRLVKYGIVTAAPTYLWQETARAWAESDPRPRGSTAADSATPRSEVRVKAAIIDA
jgi:hypothetical protein